MNTFRLALRMLRRDLRAGEFALLGVALLIAVASLTSVGFLTERVRQGLDRDANQLLGGDLLISADQPLPPSYTEQARQLGLQVVRTALFNSMASTADAAQLTAVKAVEPGYPLRGSLQVAPRMGEPGRDAQGIPQPGEAWVDEQLLTALQLSPGDSFQLGYLTLRVGRVITFESDRGMGFSSFVPRVLIHTADLAPSGLIQEGSRVRYRLQLAGERPTVDRFEEWVRPRLGRGERLESIDNARPEVRGNLDRAHRFLRMAAMLSVVLAAVAIGLSARRYLERHLDGCAVMRCFGAQRAQLLGLYLTEFVLFGLLVAAAGCMVGFGVQAALAGLAASILRSSLPAPGWVPVAHGMLVGVVLMAGFVAPQLLRLARVPPIRVLRREWDGAEPASLGAWLAGAAALAGLMFWIAGEARLGAVVVGGFSLALALFALMAWWLLGLFARARHLGGGWGLRYGLAALYRRRGSSVVQTVALAVGLTAILLLTLVGQDLLNSWRSRLAPDAPNRFVLNIQPEQREAVLAFLARQNLGETILLPMIRGRLVAINGRPVSARDYVEERAANLVEREFNLSYSSRLQAGNRVVAGRWHGDTREPVFSMEEGLGKTLGVKLGDRVAFEIAGQRVEGAVSSIRKLDWDSMRVNFFFTAAPGLLETYPASFITSFYLPAEHQGVVRDLVAQFPNLTVIDVGAMLAQVESLTRKLVSVVEFVFSFALLAGGIVLLAAQQTTHGERAYEISVLRALGARHRQVRTALLAEFAGLGVMSALLAGAAALAIGYALADQAFNLEFRPAWLPLGLALIASALAIVMVGWLGMRGLLKRTVVEGIRAEA